MNPAFYSEAGFAELSEYWTELGRFIHGFSSVERALQAVAWQTAGVTHEVARVVFGKLRVEATIEVIRSLQRSQGLEADPRQARAFAHLKVIARIRNDVVHQGADFTTDGLKVTNVLMALPGNERTTAMSPAILRDLSMDLVVVQTCLMIPIIESVPMPTEMKDQWRTSASTPWRYSSAKSQ